MWLKHRAGVEISGITPAWCAGLKPGGCAWVLGNPVAFYSGFSSMCGLWYWQWVPRMSPAYNQGATVHRQCTGCIHLVNTFTDVGYNGGKAKSREVHWCGVPTVCMSSLLSHLLIHSVEFENWFVITDSRVRCLSEKAQRAVTLPFFLLKGGVLPVEKWYCFSSCIPLRRQLHRPL